MVNHQFIHINFADTYETKNIYLYFLSVRIVPNSFPTWFSCRTGTTTAAEGNHY